MEKQPGDATGRPGWQHPSADERRQARLWEKEYGGSQAGLVNRWSYYRHALHGEVIYYWEAYRRLEADPSGSLLDVGCSDGVSLSVIRALQEQGGHSGPIVGVDLKRVLVGNRAAKRLTRMFYDNNVLPIQFVVGSGDHLPFRDNTFDSAMAMFSLYHLPNLHRGLDELHRVVKPLGRVAVATSSRLNKIIHRRDEVRIAEAKGASPPLRFTEKFPTEVAEAVLPRFFRVVDRFDHRDVARFTGEVVDGRDGYDAYKASLDTMQPYFLKPSETPRGRRKPAFETLQEWEDTLAAVVEPEFRRRFAKGEPFDDLIDRTIFILENPAD
ncbi:MAG TPA: methyltransferase domain-containing protein [Candidatus Saccharimonadales bacterium]|nr:methyltransferase domain-containing protein [Candidatus Saccharimonadales bacterium]